MKKEYNFQKEIFYWLNRISDSEELPKNIIAILIGLFESDNGYTIYLIGSKTFNEDDSDWACNNDFKPKNKYFVVDDDKLNDKNWEVILSLTIEAVKKYQRKYPDSLVEKIEHLAIGFDDGDLTIIK